ILAVLLAPVVVLHVLHAPRAGPFENDPSYYLQAARHVAEGDGLTSSVSLYHEGVNPLPQPYDVYPLWPVVLGATATVIGVIAAANVLPQLLFIVDLVLFYLLANKLSGPAESRPAHRAADIDIGPLVALLV